MNQTLKDIGDELKTAREAKGLKLKDLSERLKIRNKYLDALESGVPDDLPPAYVKGYLGNYARELGLDAESLKIRYAEASDADNDNQLSLPQPPQEGMRPTPFVLAISLATAIAFYGYHYYQEKQKTSLPQTAGHPITAAAPAQSNEKTAPPSSTTEENADATPPLAETDLQPVFASLEPGSNLVLLATKSTWVQVLNEKREFLLEKKLRPGDSYKLPDSLNLVIRAGNATAIEVFVDGQQHKRLGTLDKLSPQKPGNPLSAVSPASGE